MQFLLEAPSSINTISDVIAWAEFLFYLPGSLLISWIGSYPKAAHFFEITHSSGNGIPSLIFSLIFWWILYGSFKAIKSEGEKEDEFSR